MPAVPTATRGVPLRRRVLLGAGWMVALRWLDRLVGVVSLAVLARLLLPADFGVVGYAMLVIGLLEICAGLSTDAALIQDQQATRADYDAAWTLNLVKGVVLGLLVLALAAPAARYFGEPRLQPVMYCPAAMPVLEGLINIGTVDFRKHLEFRREFTFLTSTRLASTAVTILLAVWLRDHWALVVGILGRSGARMVLSYGVQPFRPQLNLARVAHIFRFSRWMLLQQLSAGLNARLPEFAVARLADSAALALFTIGREIAMLATTELKAPIRRALFPGLARVAADRPRLAMALVETSGHIVIVALPLSLGLALTAADLVPLMLGENWQAAVPFVAVLGFAAAVSALGSSSFLGFVVTGRPYVTAWAGVARLALLAPLAFLLVGRHGAIGAAYAVLLCDAMAVLVDYLFSARLLGIRLSRLLAVIWRSLLAALTMAAAVLGLRAELPLPASLEAHAGSLALSAFAGALAYASALLLLARATAWGDGPERQLLRLLVGLGRRPAAGSPPAGAAAVEGCVPGRPVVGPPPPTRRRASVAILRSGPGGHHTRGDGVSVRLP